MQRKTGLGIRKEKREGEEIAEDKRGPKAKRRRRYEEREEEERTTDASAALESCDEMQELASFSPTENDATSSHPLAQAVLRGLRSFSHHTNSPALCPIRLTPRPRTLLFSSPTASTPSHPASHTHAAAPHITHPRHRTPTQSSPLGAAHAATRPRTWRAPRPPHTVVWPPPR